MSTIKSSDEHLTLNADGTSKDIKFQANGVEKASISSAGAFTSTTIDATKLTGTIPNFTSTGIDDNADATTITIDSRENVGIGVVPESDWYNGGGEIHYHILQIGASSAVGGYVDNSTYLGANWKDDGNNKYINTDEASLYVQQSGQHRFLVAPSGSADSAITWTTGIKIDNSGYVTMPSQPAFSATKSGGNQTSTGVIVFNTVQTNIGSHYNNSNGRFTAPVAGQYYFSVFLMSSNDPSAFDVTFRKNGSLYTPLSPYFGDGPQYTQISGSAVVTLAANDYVDFELQATGGGQVYGSGPNGKHSNFSGFLIG